MWLAVDDTDGPQGGCTTHVAHRLLEALDCDLRSTPRLVRLNPMAPWKTRGNGAVALHLAGPASREVADRAWDLVQKHAQPDADPGLVVTETRPPHELYRAAVTRILDVDEVPVPGEAHVRGGRGRIGALAALAWRPGDVTWELLAYREPKRWGTPRHVDPATIRRLPEVLPSTFDCWDAGQDQPAMVPNGPDPVLYGLRGDDPDALRAGRHLLDRETPVGSRLFLTNQGTDDHLVRQGAGELASRTNAVVRGRVAGEPTTIEGGHTFVDVEDATGRCTLAAYEPTKGFRDVVRRLRPGDEVVACGGTSDGSTVNLEKIRVDDVAEIEEKVENPTCCGKHMDSKGARAGYYCSECGRRTDDDAARYEVVDRGLAEGWYEVPASARRHLAKPLKRLGRDEEPDADRRLVGGITSTGSSTG